jgi:nicotinate-nucleotide adenylyltransferase
LVRERIGIYGGTFDPIHLGHLILAVELRHALALDRVLFVPAGEPPHKPAAPISLAHHRVRMIELSIAGRTGLELSSIDIEREGPSFTRETLQVVARQFPRAELVFLMGADSLRDLPSWRDPARILALAELGVATRPGVDIDLDTLLVSLPQLKGRFTLVDSPRIAISSRDIRDRIASGRPISYHVVREVEQYLRLHRLYEPVPATP